MSAETPDTRHQINGISRRDFIASAVVTTAAALLGVSGCSPDPDTHPNPADITPLTDFSIEDLRYDSGSNDHLTPLNPKPNGRQLVFAQIGDSKVAAAGGFPQANREVGTDKLMGLSRWHAGLDPYFHSDLRPCTTDTSIFDKKPDEWMPKAFKTIINLPISGVIVNTPLGIYSYQGEPGEKGSNQAEWYEIASGVIKNMREMIQMAYKKTQAGTPMALTFLHPVQIPIPEGDKELKNFDLIRVNEDMLELMQKQITGVVSNTPLLRLSVNSDWWGFIKNKVTKYGGDVSRLSTLFDPDDQGFLMHPVPDGEQFYYGDIIVKEYEDMDRFVRKQAGLPKS